MKTTIRRAWQGVRMGLAIGAALVALGAAPLMAQENGQLFATQEEGYGRLILSFPGRDTLPKYSMRLENGVLSLEFEEPISIILPDVGTTMPSYLSVARVDPDGRGLRLGLRSAFTFNRIEAGEKLFIDLLPNSWQGMPPALPQDVVEELAERARLAAIRAEQDRKRAGVEEFNPQATIRIGRNPTFMRVQFDWSVPTTAEYVQEEDLGLIAFEWPVDIDLRELASILPAEILSVEGEVTPDGSRVLLQVAEGIKPRFYENSPQQYVLDIDIAGQGLPQFELPDPQANVAHASTAPNSDHPRPDVDALYPASATAPIKPFVSVLGSTVRMVFPFEQDTPAAVFRRGDTVWMMFDSTVGILPPDASQEFEAVAQTFDVTASADAQVVRLDLAQDRLATLGSEGRAWVLSLGDIMLTPTEPIELSRRRGFEGEFEMVAKLTRPARIHEFRDPVVGDLLRVVTAYPPARGITRTLDYVEFSALRSVHGLVVKPEVSNLAVSIESDLAVIGTPGGLTVSALDAPRSTADAASTEVRSGFVDLVRLEQTDFGAYDRQLHDLQVEAARAEGEQRDRARLDLARYYIANQFAHEALGVLRVLENDIENKDNTRELRLLQAVATTMAGRTPEALAILNSATLGKELDGLIWRTIARADAYDYRGARLDAMEAQAIVESYPAWVRHAFSFAAIRAAIEADDLPIAESFLQGIEFAELNPEQASEYHLLAGRIDEARGRIEEALDTYGQVIAADFRPTRAEAVYRTLGLLQQQGTLDLGKAAQTLAAEAMLWRGNPLEANMQNMLAKLYFENGDYRLGFETVRQAVSTYPESPPVNALQEEAARWFNKLFLEGAADALGPVEALSVYYDFRELTPAGTRGDEMIRNLARRLVRVDLLSQAAELLEYQLDNRLRGVARTQVAADLAVIYLADRRPQEALRVLNATRLPGLPDSLARQRRILEARAMIDGGRDQLALDMLRDMAGRDVDLLRIEAHWKARRYSQASEMLEALYAGAPVSGALAQPARMNLVKAGVGYVLGNDSIGLSRLRSKFGDAMVTTPEWPMFDLVTGQVEVTSLEFKTVASQISNVEGINAFLASYRETYGAGGALAPMGASEPGAGLAAR